MKKMIDQEKINKSDALFEGMTADKDGNVTIGKNLEVDGDVTINSADNLKTKDGTSFGGIGGILFLKYGDTILYDKIKQELSNGNYKSLVYTDKQGNIYTSNYLNDYKKWYDIQTNKIVLNAFLAMIKGSATYNNISMYMYAAKITINENGSIAESTDKSQYNRFELSKDSTYNKWSICVGQLCNGGFLIADNNSSSTPKFLQCVNSKFSWTELPKYFNHDVKIMFNSVPLMLNIVNTSNTPIDSITDLKTACGSRTQVMMTGMFQDDDLMRVVTMYNPQTNKITTASTTGAKVAGNEILLATHSVDANDYTLGAITDDITTL